MTAEQLHDALGLLPADLIEEADACRQNPGKKPIPFRRWTALAAVFALVLGCGLVAGKTGLLFNGRKDAATEMAAPQAPMEEMAADTAPAAMDEPGARNELPEEECDCAQSEVVDSTYGTPPVDVGSAVFARSDLPAVFTELLKNAEAAAEFGLDYDEDWFADFDLLLISLPQVESVSEFSVGQGSSPLHWEIRITEGAPAEDTLLILIPVQKGHIPRDAEFEMIWE